ncbi:hypothetical protein SAMN05216474_2286 [Lishizhenia tianjinensis]|uniref:Glycosyl transferases group 1 n=1 Tax=Lishizhenia tianjinensis TaxID=477690 RepID=A0A1I7APF1_9FLAO|nr:hypothetical protein [Lishizhenia tianjinensis]SFT76776.1 hypothetical protein SAMN05216474_2286 [Lishizhenia tianjinensis]
MARKRVILVGLCLFTKRLEKQIKAFGDKRVSVKALDTYYTNKDRLLAFLLIPFCDVVYSINVTTTKSRTFDWAFFWKKRVMLFWAGSDVLRAKNNPNRNQKYLQNAEHFCEAPWIQEELKEIGVHAELLRFTNFKGNQKIDFPSTENGLKVFSYVAKGREVYYGLNHIIALATRFPEVDFRVAGTNGEGFDIPTNVKCLGWCDDMLKEYEKCHVTTRIIEHDGFSNFVLESLFHRKHVLYSNKLNHCLHASTTEEGIRHLERLVDLAGKNELSPNEDGREFVKKELNTEDVLGKLISKFAE